MKVRESGMPEESLWSGFFDVPNIFNSLEITSELNRIAEIGCGYGTFTLPLSKMIQGEIFSFDIDAAMINKVKQQLDNENMNHVKLINRDVLSEGTGIVAGYLDYLMLFNLLHNASPEVFLDEAARVLKVGGRLGIIHWRSDIDTPRGPSLDIRTKPEQIMQWMKDFPFKLVEGTKELKPYHYGMIWERSNS